MAQELTIVRQENIQTIVSAAPQSYQDNAQSRERCLSFGQSLLDTIAQQGGMTDELDKKVADYLVKARKTVNMMNSRRSPFTKLFDDIRKEFTVLENAIDATKADTIPYRLQQLRNQYAAKKRADEEARRQAEIARQQAEQARQKMKQEIEDDFNRQFQGILNKAINHLTGLDAAASLENYEDTLASVKNFPATLPEGFVENLRTSIRIPSGISVDEIRKAELEIKARLSGNFAEMYSYEVQSNKDYILDRLPSKKANLERMAQANAEEAARMKAEMEERERKEAAAKEAERIRKEEEARAKAEMDRQQAELGGLFNAQAAQAEYSPKSVVTKKIEVLNPEGILPVFSMWWSKEGCTLSTAELVKLFKKQISFCEKLANKEQLFIEDESVCYVDDVKAK